MKKIIWINGLISGVVITTFMVGGIAASANEPMDCENLGGSQLVGYISMIIALSTIFVAVKRYRDKYNQGKIKFAQAFLIGLFISLIATTMYTAGWAAYASTEKGSSWGDEYASCVAQNIDNNRELNETQKAEQKIELKNQMEFFSGPLGKIAVSLEILPVGLLMSLLAAFILKKTD